MVTSVRLCLPLACSATTFVVLAGAAVSQETVPEVTFESLLEEMIDRDRLARLPEPAYTCHQTSSYERESTARDKPGWFANHDWSHFIRSERHDGRGEWVMMEAEGPGCLVRFWMGAPDPAYGPLGTIRVYLDGAREPVIEEQADDLLSGRGLVGPPWSAVRSIGRNLYLPIPYASQCSVTYELPNYWETKRPEHRTWYVINYRKYAPGTKVAPFRMEDFEQAQPTLARVGRRLLSPSNALAAGTMLTPATTRRLQRGDRIRRNLAGPGTIRQLSVQLDAGDLPQALRSTVLSIEFDGQPTVWCPAGDFFGSGVGLNPYRGWWRTVDRNGLMTCFWVMPYQESCTIELVNLGEEPVDATLGMIGCTRWSWDDRSMHFHANWRQEYPLASKGRDGFDWNYIEIKGRGVYVGDTLAIHNGTAAWWGEGDEKIFVDGEAFPSHFGTGTEDYYGYSFGDRGVFFEAPFHAQPRSDGNNSPGHVTNTRTRSLDAIPFNESLRLDMEVWHWAQTTMAYAAATYWYARPGATSNRPPAPEEAARPVPGKPRVVPGAIEGETMKIAAKTGGIVEHQSDVRWSGGKQLWWRDGKPGDKLELVLAVPEPGHYEITMHNTRAFDYGVFQLALDGENLGDPIDLYSRENVVQLVTLGTRQLDAGDHRLTIQIVGTNPDAQPRHMLGLDYIKLEGGR